MINHSKICQECKLKSSLTYFLKTASSRKQHNFQKTPPWIFWRKNDSYFWLKLFRPAVQSNVWLFLTAVLNPFFVHIVALFAKRLKISISPELLQITSMRLNVIANCCHRKHSTALAEPAKWLSLELFKPQCSPGVILVHP